MTTAWRYALFALRAVVITFLGLLLVSPLVRSVTYKPQKPLILVAQDNSASIRLAGKNKALPSQTLASLRDQLGNGYDVREFNFDKQLHEGLSATYNGKQTDISNALHQLNDRFVNQNIGAVVLATDGISNLGTDPAYEARNIKSSIYTVAFGDTVPRRDLLIRNINYNKTAFLGNDMEVEVLVAAYQSKGEQMRLTVTEDGRQVHSQAISVTSNELTQVVPLKLNAGKKGLRKFTFNIAPVSNELSVQNNSETVYVDVLDARQKVLLVYEGPHPDVSTIRQSIEANRNFEVKTVLADDLGKTELASYNLAILYQLSAAGYSKAQPLLSAKIPLWVVAATQADMRAFNNAQSAVKVIANRDDAQEVFPQLVPTFAAFTLSDSTRNRIIKFPPLLSAYGSYEAQGSTSVMLKQRIGSVATNYPLLAFADVGGRRTAVLTGEGVWKWQLAEYREYGNHHATEELFGQVVQYLTANANRERFRVYSSKAVFDEGEDVLLNAELYNDALELVNTPDVSISLKNTSGKSYSYLFTRTGQSYQLNAGALPVGEYTYGASTRNGKQQFLANGKLTVRPLDLESRQSAADHKLLRTIASRSGGKFLYPEQAGQLANLIKNNENIKTVVYEDKHFNDLIDIRWIFGLLLLLLSAEWFLRKREGEV